MSSPNPPITNLHQPYFTVVIVKVTGELCGVVGSIEGDVHGDWSKFPMIWSPIFGFPL